MAHINPENFNHINIDPNTVCSMWFIGLEFAKTENLNVDLTYDIQTFTENVNRHATGIKMLKEGMKLEARHVKRKQLSQYLPPALLKKERKISTSSSKNGKRSSSDDTNVSNSIKKARISEEYNNQSGGVSVLRRIDFYLFFSDFYIKNFNFQCEEISQNSLSLNDDSNSNLSMTENVSNGLSASKSSENSPAQAVCT